MWMPFFARAGSSSSRQQRYCCSIILRTRLRIARNVSLAVLPSMLRSTMSLSICCLRPATRTSKNSSRFEEVMVKNFTRSRRGLAGFERLVQHALVEGQPAQLAAEEMRSREGLHREWRG